MSTGILETKADQQMLPAKQPGIASWNGIVLEIILLTGLALRLYGIQFGLPDLYHADEPIVVNHAMAYGTWDFNPHFFQIPPLTSYLLFFGYGLYFALGWIAGKFANANAFANLFFSDPSSFYLLGRILIGAIPGTLTIVAVYALAKKCLGKQAALWAAAYQSVCFLAVRDSHYIYTDSLLALTLVLAMLPIVRMLERGEAKDYVLAGVLIGLCVSIKYNAALIGVPYLLAHALRPLPARKKIFSASLAKGCLAAILAFLITNPYALLDYSFFWDSVSRQGASQGFVGWFHHALYSLNGGMGGLALTAGLAGMGLLLFQKNQKAVLLAGFVLPFYAAITLFGQPHDRYVLPLIPFLSVFLGAFVVFVMQRLRTEGKTAWSRWAGVFAFFFLIFPMLVKSSYSDWLFLQTDSRTLARQWIEQNIPAGSKIALDHTFYNPVLKPTQEQLLEKRRLAESKETQVAQKQAKLDRLISLVKPDDKRYELYFLSDEPAGDRGYLFSEPQLPFDFERLRREGIDAVVSHRVFARKPHFAFWARVEQHAREAHLFSPYREDWRDFSMEPQVRTGGAFLWPEMLARKSNGEHVTVYLLKK